uniref:non-specific serine/threonine protein kinase n=1 Tax=Syphacia muris TaxID=451379 RepID=A0A0N5ARF8_9BILA
MDAYKKIHVVGRGAHGTCWLCIRKDDEFQQKVIVKTISLDGLNSDEETAVMHEVTLLKRLHHPNIIGYFESFKAEKGLSIVMQYSEGGTMDNMICERKGVKFSESAVLDYFTQVAVGLEYMHSKNILHRDLKTKNILLNKKRTIVKLSDFGISKELASRSLASTVIGTPNYLSPEICEGRYYNEKSDIWALGCVLYELCELRKAFEGNLLTALVVKIAKGQHGPISEQWSSDLKNLIRNILSVNESKRPTIKEILTCPLILSVCLSVHLDLGSLPSGVKKRARQVYGFSGRTLRTIPSCKQ